MELGVVSYADETQERIVRLAQRLAEPPTVKQARKLLEGLEAEERAGALDAAARALPGAVEQRQRLQAIQREMVGKP